MGQGQTNLEETVGSERGWVRAWAYFASKYKDAGRSEHCSWIHRAPWQHPAKAGGLCGDPGQEQRGPSTPLSLSEVFLSAWAPCAERERSLSVQGSPFRRCLGLWNNRWCFYNLSEACSWVDGERQYLRTTGLQEVVKLLLPIYIFWQCFHWGVFPLFFIFF